MFCLVETGSPSVALGDLELVIYSRLPLNSQRLTRLCLVGVGIKGLYHHALLKTP